MISEYTCRYYYYFILRVLTNIIQHDNLSVGILYVMFELNSMMYNIYVQI